MGLITEKENIMRTITVEKTLYTFNELSSTAKDHARSILDTFEFQSECTLEDFTTLAGLMGFYDIKPRYSGFWSQGDGASFTGHYKYAKGGLQAVKEYAPQDMELHRIAQGLQAMQARHGYQLQAVLTLGTNSNMYAHENTIDCESTVHDVWVKDETQKEFRDLARALMRWLYRALEAAYDDCNTDEYLIDHCESNGYEFDEKGNLA
jgi:hypothetical protein